MMLLIEEKVRLLEKLKEKKRYAEIGHHYGINESIDHYKNDEKI